MSGVTASGTHSPLSERVKLRVALHVGRWSESTGDGEGILIPISVEATSGINQVYQDTVRWKLQPRIPWQTARLPEGNSGLEEDG
jgi:hypothetical protein